MSERLCSDCAGLLAPVDDALDPDGGEGDLACVVCGAAATLGGLLRGEVAAREADASAA